MPFWDGVGRRLTLVCAMLCCIVPSMGSRLARGEIVADSADDVCPPSADPCIITDRVVSTTVMPLDFGTRRVEVTGGAGQLDFTSFGGGLLCGDLIVDSDANPAIDVRNPIDRLDLDLIARRGCGLDPALPCLRDADCVPAGGGTCSVGEGRVQISSTITGRSPETGEQIAIFGAGDVTLDGLVDVSSGLAVSGLSEGGWIYVSSVNGSVRVNGPMKADAVGETAGEFTLLAAQDIVINAPLSARSRGYFGEGGGLEASAGRDVLLNASLDLKPFGYAELHAVRNVAAGTGATQVKIRTGGTDSGSIAIFAGGDVLLGEALRVHQKGLVGEGAGAELYVSAGGDIVSHAKVRMKDGFASLHLLAARDLVLGPESYLVLKGRDAGTTIQLQAGRDLLLQGVLDAGGGRFFLFGAPSPSIELRAGGSATVDGKIRARWKQDATITLEGCGVEVTDEGRIDARGSLHATDVSNLVIGHGQIQVHPQARIGTNLGANRLTYRDAGLPPVLDGELRPAPVLTHDPTLPACP